MKTTDIIIAELKKELEVFIKRAPSFKHILWDSFSDHKLRYRKDLEIIDRFFNGGKILDVGSSPFHLLILLSKKGYDVTGIDLNPTKFKKFIDDYRLSVKKSNIESQKFPFPNNSFDMVLFNEVFEHLRINPIFTLGEIYRVLKPRGTLFLTTPNLYAIHKIFLFNLGKSFNDAYDEFAKLNAYGYMGHIREYSVTEVKKFLGNTGFKIDSVIHRNDFSFFGHKGINNIFLKIAGLVIDLIMIIVPPWRRHIAIIATKKELIKK